MTGYVLKSIYGLFYCSLRKSRSLSKCYELRSFYPLQNIKKNPSFSARIIFQHQILSTEMEKSSRSPELILKYHAAIDKLKDEPNLFKSHYLDGVSVTTSIQQWFN